MADLNDDIVKYLRGELTPAEMHALEEKALRDPFLADALEGAALVNPDSLKSDLEGLQQRVTARTIVKAGRDVSFWVWPARIAAGLLLLILSTIVVVNLTSRDSKEDLALNKQSAPADETNGEQKGPTLADSAQKESDSFLSQAEPTKDITTKAPSVETKPAEIPATPQVAEKELSSPPKEEARADKEEITDDIIVAQETAQPNPQPAVSATESKKAEDSRLSLRKKNKSGEAAAGAAAERSIRDEPLNQRVVQGQVVATDGSALPGVNVIIKGTNVGTVTDADGNYQISVGPESTSLVFSFIGYISTELPAGQSGRTDVQLNEDMTSLSEVVVVGYSQGASDNSQESTYEMATPAGGRRAFKQYLEKNLKYPDVALEKKVQGKVTVQFTVEPTGQLSDFKVVKGIGSGCDEEVIRLIMQGPQWTPSKKNNDPLKDIIKVRMKFELPK